MGNRNGWNIHGRLSTHSIHAMYCCVEAIMCELKHKIAPIQHYIEKKNQQQHTYKLQHIEQQ